MMPRFRLKQEVTDVEVFDPDKKPWPAYVRELPLGDSGHTGPFVYSCNCWMHVESGNFIQTTSKGDRFPMGPITLRLGYEQEPFSDDKP